MLKLVLGTRDWSNAPLLPRPPPLSPKDGRFRKRRQALRQLPLVCVEGESLGQSQHIFPKSLNPGFQMRAMGCHWEKGVIRNMRTCPCPHCSRAIAGKVEDWADKVHSPVEKAQCHSWRWGREKHTPGELATVVTTCSPSLIPLMYFFPDTEGVEGQSPHLFSLSRHKERLELMRKRENGTKILISLKWTLWRKPFWVWEVKVEKTSEGMNPGTALFFLSQPSNWGKQAKSKRGSRNLSLRLLYVLLGAGV